MSTQKDNRIDFKGQHFYIGLDVHKKSWAVNIRNNGLRLKAFSMDPYPEKLRRFLEENYPGGTYHVVYEVGFCGFWILPDTTGDENGLYCSQSGRYTDRAQGKKTAKTDPVDAAKLARELEKGSLKCIYITDEADQHFACSVSTFIALLYRIPPESRTGSKGNCISTESSYLATLPSGRENSSPV